MKPRLLDLFCGAGGAAVGYHRAGFDVAGVDHRPQPHYPFEFVQEDALEFLRYFNLRDLDEFDVIHASPPCQHYSGATAWRGDRNSHPDLIQPTRNLLVATGLPYVIENVPDARRHLHDPFMLCGSQFGLAVRRHRYFEAPWWPFQMMSPCRHDGQLPFEHKGERAYANAMRCDWMTSVEAREAIPPAYTELVGTQLLAHLKVAA